MQVQTLLQTRCDELQDQLWSVPKVLHTFDINQLLHLSSRVDHRLHGFDLNYQFCQKESS